MVNVQISGVPVIVNGERSGVLGLYQDITDRNRAEQILRESEVRYRSLFEDSPISLWEEDFSEVKKEIDLLRASGIDNFAEFFGNNIAFVKSIVEKIKIININSATVQLFKAESKEKFYSGLNYVIPMTSLSVIADEFSKLADGNTTYTSEIDHRDFNGKTIHSLLRLSIAPGYEENWGKVFISIIDITERKINESYLKHLSTHDQLTGLANRALMFELLNHVIANSKRSQKKIAVLFIDLDGFKAINDQFGHAVGDEFLILTADRLRSCLRESDTIARVGGDEFIAILENLELYSTIEIIADKLLKIVSIPHTVFGKTCCVTASIGISMHPANGSNPEQLISLADTAMYQSKQKGKNKFTIIDI
jgi:diguanylate cyclase (GGDEF)-like protein